MDASCKSFRKAKTVLKVYGAATRSGEALEDNKSLEDVKAESLGVKLEMMHKLGVPV